LLESVAVIAGDTTDLADRRQCCVQILADLIQADAGIWAWDCGNPQANSNFVPVAVIHCGVTPQQLISFMEHGLVLSPSSKAPRSMSSEDEWRSLPSRSLLQRNGWGTWLNSIRHSPSGTWSSLFLARNLGRDEFNPRDAAIVDLALTSITWLHSTADELQPTESFAGLTAR
jgi:hypothetical protein